MSSDPARNPQPPMSLMDSDFPAHPHKLLSHLRETCPVAQIHAAGRQPVWVITRDQDVRAAFLDPRLSLHHPAPAERPHRPMQRSLVDYDPPHHTKIRRLAARAFTPARIEHYRPIIEQTAERLLDHLPTAEPVDLMSQFARPLVYAALCRLLAIQPEYQPDLLTWLTSLFSPPSPDAARSNTKHLEDYIDTEVDRRRTLPGDDLLSQVINTWQDDADVSREELASLAAMIVVAGFDSTVQMIGACIAALLAHPDLLTALHTDLSRVPHAVEELLRWDTTAPFSTKRHALQDITIGDTRIPAGSPVLLSMAAANRDPRTYATPDHLDLDRPTSARHLAFGHGPHYCLGAPLARMEISIALAALLRRHPHVRPITPAAPPWTGTYKHRVLTELPVRLQPHPEKLPRRTPGRRERI